MGPRDRRRWWVRPADDRTPEFPLAQSGGVQARYHAKALHFYDIGCQQGRVSDDERCRLLSLIHVPAWCHAWAPTRPPDPHGHVGLDWFWSFALWTRLPVPVVQEHLNAALTEERGLRELRARALDGRTGGR